MRAKHYGVQQHTRRQVVWSHTQGNETFHRGVAENRMVGALTCGWILRARRTSAGNIEKATNPRKNERVENSVPWFDRDKMAYAGLIALRLGIR